MLSISYDKFKMGNNIRKGMEKKGLTQEELAEKMDVSRETISQWTTGNRKPKYEHLVQLCSILDVDIGYLFNEYEEKNVDTHYICQLTGLNEDAVNKLQEIEKTNSATGNSDKLSLLITHPKFIYLLSLLANNTTGKTDIVSYEDSSFILDKKDIINSVLKDVIVEIASFIRNEYKPNEYAIYYDFLFGLFRSGKISEKQLEEIKSEYDKGNFDYSPRKMS